MSSKSKRDDGLTYEEGEVMDALCEAWGKFSKLKREHPDELKDFCNAIHQCQYVLGMRILRRDYPQGYPKRIKENYPELYK